MTMTDLDSGSKPRDPCRGRSRQVWLLWGFLVALSPAIGQDVTIFAFQAPTRTAVSVGTKSMTMESGQYYRGPRLVVETPDVATDAVAMGVLPSELVVLLDPQSELIAEADGSAGPIGADSNESAMLNLSLVSGSIRLIGSVNGEPELGLTLTTRHGRIRSEGDFILRISLDTHQGETLVESIAGTAVAESLTGRETVLQAGEQFRLGDGPQLIGEGAQTLDREGFYAASRGDVALLRMLATEIRGGIWPGLVGSNPPHVLPADLDYKTAVSPSVLDGP